MIDATFGDIYLADFGVSAQAGAHTGKVIFDTPDNINFDGMAQVTEFTALFRTADFPLLQVGGSFTVNGTAYRVLEVYLLEDGLFSRANLQNMAKRPLSKNISLD